MARVAADFPRHEPGDDLAGGVAEVRPEIGRQIRAGNGREALERDFYCCTALLDAGKALSATVEIDDENWQHLALPPRPLRTLAAPPSEIAALDLLQGVAYA